MGNVDGGSAFEDLPKRLMGYSHMGAISAGDQRLDTEAWLRTLRANNVNFTRVWVMELWTALADLTKQGVAPFAGTPYQPGQESFNLFSDSEAFYNRLRKFVQNAADRGIVVELDAFEKHGLTCDDSPGKYRDSPYRDANNTPQHYMADTGCTCGLGGGPTEDPDSPPPCRPLATFIDDNHEIASVHRRLVSRIGHEVGGIGNVIFEIINEALAPFSIGTDDYDGDWAVFGAQHPYPNESWQQSVLRDLRLNLPLESTATSNYVVRDAFNGDADATAISGKQSDIENAAWLAGWSSGAAVYVASTEGATDGSLGPPRKLGFVSSQETGPSMVGSLLIGSGAQWTQLEARADMTCSRGKLQIGLNHALGGNNVFATLDCGNVISGGPIAPKIYLYEKVGGQYNVLESTIFPDPYSLHNVRLELAVDPSNGGLLASVFLDGAIQIKSDALTDDSDVTSAFFWGSSCSGDPTCIYPKGAGIVDNFEVARFCDDESRGCQP